MSATKTGNIRPEEMPPEIRKQFRELNKVPKLAWPTVFLTVFLVASFIALWALALTHTVPSWVCGITAGIVGYWSFSVIHDGIHRSIASNVKVNDWISRIGLAIIVPWVALELFRWGHAMHHRFTGGPRDPDLWSQGPWWQLPFRWMLIDVGYVSLVLKTDDPVAKKHLRRNLWHIAAAVVIAAVLVSQGYGEQAFWMMLVPSRIALFGLGFVFFWLPHVPHEVEQAENFTRATTVRLGYEKIFNVLLQGQNFHLIHHMYPTTPFYNNSRLWHVMEPMLRERDLAIQHGFAIQPEIYTPPRLAQAA